ncbi:3914_t:CDS:2, partial [Scutellospora calospora]
LRHSPNLPDSRYYKESSEVTETIQGLKLTGSMAAKADSTAAQQLKDIFGSKTAIAVQGPFLSVFRLYACICSARTLCPQVFGSTAVFAMQGS